MATGRKRGTSSARIKQILSLIDEYESETGDHSGDLMLVAKWLWHEGKFRLPKYDPIKRIASYLASASRQDYFANENGEPVRRRHAYPVESAEGKQTTFAWFKIEDATPEKMRLSASARRNGTLGDILQLVRDVDYFNRHHNPGDPIEVPTDFTADVAEARFPTTYPDAPPEPRPE
ncbi:MAG: hypothetical protein DCC68_01570 [Planctomycetota bacterium]|nr:MAG: hypothetical protein DCC68_01570 [Planctomycetota bacterium]